MDFELENFRRETIAKRNAAKANTPLGHRYSTAIEQRQHKAELERLIKNNDEEIAELELEALLG